jgi:hypothetical protein
VIVNLAKKRAFVNHYSFHIMDPQWGHVTIKMSGHPPFSAQVILNGHEYVAASAQAAGIGFTKQGNCFTAVADPAGLARVADTLSQEATVGRLSQVCDRWIYSACLCFGLDLDEQARSGFTYGYSVYQAEYSRNLIFKAGAQMEKMFDRIVDRTRSRLDVPTLRTLFGAKQRPSPSPSPSPSRSRSRSRSRSGSGSGSSELSLQLAAMIETPRYDLTMFKIHFGLLTLKAYTKGERVLRFEAITHNTKQLRCGRILEKFPEITHRLAGMVERFTTALDCVDVSFLPEDTLDELPLPSRIGATQIGGIDLNKPRIRSALAAVLALSAAPGGFTVTDLATKVHTMTGQTGYTTRQAAYDLRKLRAKNLIVKPGRSRRYHLPPQPARIITALLTLREPVISPILAGIQSPRRGRKPAHWTSIDRDHETLRTQIQTPFHHLGITTTGAATA